MSGIFEIYKDKTGEFRFRLKAFNGQTILTSEGYKDKTGCINGIESTKRNSQDDKLYEKKESASGTLMFNLNAANYQIIGTSDQYETEASRNKAIDSVKRYAISAKVVDQST